MSPPVSKVTPRADNPRPAAGVGILRRSCSGAAGRQGSRLRSRTRWCWRSFCGSGARGRRSSASRPSRSSSRSRTYGQPTAARDPVPDPGARRRPQLPAVDAAYPVRAATPAQPCLPPPPRPPPPPAPRRSPPPSPSTSSRRPPRRDRGPLPVRRPPRSAPPSVDELRAYADPRAAAATGPLPRRSAALRLSARAKTRFESEAPLGRRDRARPSAGSCWAGYLHRIKTRATRTHRSRSAPRRHRAPPPRSRRSLLLSTAPGCGRRTPPPRSASRRSRPLHAATVRRDRERPH